MTQERKCPKCGGSNIAGPHKVSGKYPIRVDIAGFHTATLRAFTCADCGFTEFYVDSKGLKNIHKDDKTLSRPQEGETAHCPLCGAEVVPGTTVCPECGNTIQN